VLTKAEKRKIDICADRISTPSLTIKQLCRKHSVSHHTIDKALEWGREQGFFTANSEDKIRQHICDLQKILSVLEYEYKEAATEARRRRREARKYNRSHSDQKNPPFGLTDAITGLARKILDYKTRIMELEGLYHKVVEHRGEINHKLSEPLMQMVVQIANFNGKQGDGEE